MSFFRQLLPGATPPRIAKQGDMAVIRERVLQVVALFFAIFGIVTYIVAMRDALSEGSLINMAAFTIVFLGAIFVAVNRRLPYRLRAILLLMVVLGGALFSFFEYGLGGNARIFLFAFVALSGMFMGQRFGGWSLLVSVLILAAFAAGMTVGFIPAPALGANADSRNWADWMLAITYFFLLASTSYLTSGQMVQNLEKSLGVQKNLAAELSSEQVKLENRVLDRTADLERRLVQIRTSVDINRAISSLLDPQVLLQEVVNLVQERLDLYYVGVFLLDEAGIFAELRAGTGDAGQKMLAAGHRLQVGGASMIGWTIANQQARIALDVGKEAIRFNNPNLPLTHSELAIPIITGRRVIGAMTVQSENANAFDENDILIFQGISDSLSVAIENARLFQQSQRALDEVRSLNRQYLEKAWSDMALREEELSYTFENQAARNVQQAHQIQVPITLRDYTIGQIQIDTASGNLSPDDMSMVEAITTQTALALENARLLKETQNHAAQEEKINQLTAEFSQAFSIEEILKSALRGIGQLPSVSEVSVRLVPPDESQHQSPSASGSWAQEVDR